jgi:hypothetical protein
MAVYILVYQAEDVSCRSQFMSAYARVHWDELSPQGGKDDEGGERRRGTFGCFLTELKRIFDVVWNMD